MTTILTNRGERRLLEVADLLDNLLPSRFHFSSFVGSDWAGKPDLSCGTTACGLGWATTIPELAQEGLFLNRTEFPRSYVRVYQKRPDGSVETNSFRAASEVFDISIRDAEYLFLPHDQDGNNGLSAHCSAQELAEHIRNFVKDPSLSDCEYVCDPEEVDYYDY